MARKRMPIAIYQDSPEAKKKWRKWELENLATPSLDSQAIALEEARTAEKAWQRLRRQTLRRAKLVMSPRQYSVFLGDLAGWSDEQIAHNLGITVNAVQTYRHEYQKALLCGKSKEARI